MFKIELSAEVQQQVAKEATKCANSPAIQAKAARILEPVFEMLRDLAPSVALADRVVELSPLRPRG
ncbi:hypothetical protein ACFWPK_05870 [Nocardia sp. NPDC058519]|uniref:hypothetical protein n=1 Tax=Nocardia sp. NPDC058519 TaxID=3346535 RepID=UPI00366A16A5